MIPRDYFLLLLGMGAVTYLPRLIPLLFLSQRKVPGWLKEWLELIPVAILAAILAPALLMNANGHPDLFRKEFLIAIPVFFIARKSGSLGGTVIFGMFLYWLSGLI